MSTVKIDKQRRVTVPRHVLTAAGIAVESHVVLEATAEGAIVMRQAGVYPIELYSEKRMGEFEEANTIPAAVAERVQAYLKKNRARR